MNADEWVARIEACARQRIALEVTEAEYVELKHALDLNDWRITTPVMGGVLGAPWGVPIRVVRPTDWVRFPMVVDVEGEWGAVLGGYTCRRGELDAGVEWLVRALRPLGADTPDIGRMRANLIVERAWTRYNTLKADGRDPWLDAFTVTYDEGRCLLRELDPHVGPITGMGTDDVRIFGMRLVMTPHGYAWARS